MNARFILAGLIAATATVRAQQPVLYYDFNNVVGTNVPNLGTDLTAGILTGAAVIAAGGPTGGFSGGPAGNILTLDGADGSFVNTQLTATTLGFSTDNYTSSSWVRMNSYGGDAMIFGQQPPFVGVDNYLHNGIRDNNPHLGHWGNDTTGSTNLNAQFGTTNWFHLTFRYSGDEQSIYVNGNLVARETRGNLGNTGNVLIGSGNNGGGLPGALDDVSIYNSTLAGNQIAFLAGGGNPKALPAASTISNIGYLRAPGSISPTTINTTVGQWAVREVSSTLDVPANAGTIPDNLLQAVDVLRNPPAGFIVADGSVANINRRDPQSGASHLFPADAPFLTDTANDDDRRAFLYRSEIRVTTEGDYTFGYHGDDGFALRIGNHEWTSTTSGAGGNGRIDSDDRRTLVYAYGTGDADMRGVIHLTPGDHQIELVSWEGVGGGSHELYYAPGVFTNDGDTKNWRLVGNNADNVVNIPSVAGGWNVTTSTPVNPGNNTMTNVAAARAALTATGGAPTTGVDAVNFNDPGFGGPGSLGGDVPFLKDIAGIDDEDFAVLANGILRIEVADTYRFGFQGDDGGYLRISGVGATPGTADDWTIVENATGLGYVADLNGVASPDGDTLWTDQLTGNSRTVGDVFLAPGDYQIESLFFERGGGAFFEVFVADADTGTNFQLLASTSETRDLSSGTLQVVPEPTSVAMLLGGFGALLGFQRMRRRS